jgi:HEPN domain-containing protein
MNSKKWDKDNLIRYWMEGADDDFDTMIAMYDSKKYNWSLFIGHLMLEKLLKALYVKVNSDYPPFIHNLLRLAEKSNLVLSEDK